MKAVILAGGMGTRIAEESTTKPKPMIEIGGKPILWHIMKIYSTYGINDFIICLGYKGHIIKEYFANYFLYNSDITVDLSLNEIEIHRNTAEPWKITLVDTGESSLTGTRIKRIKEYLDDNEPFCCTYGDGVGNINIAELIKFHYKHSKLATMTVVSPPGRFGTVNIKDNLVTTFKEKADNNHRWINGGFFVLSPEVIDYISDDNVMWESDPLENITAQDQLCAYKHEGFWQPMDTLPNKITLEKLWASNTAPWKIWD
jgi:glucose-1-phosphate cytidylyltransferase